MTLYVFMLFEPSSGFFVLDFPRELSRTLSLLGEPKFDFFIEPLLLMPELDTFKLTEEVLIP